MYRKYSRLIDYLLFGVEGFMPKWDIFETKLNEEAIKSWQKLFALEKRCRQRLKDYNGTINS